MISVSDAFLAAVRSSHKLAVHATLYPPGGAVVELPIEDGAVTIDRTAAVRRTLDLTVSDNSLYPHQVTDALNVYGAEIVVERGVANADGVEETAQLGVFRVDEVSEDEPGGSIKVTGSDRSQQVMDRRFLQPHRFDATDGVALIEQLVSAVFPRATFTVNTSASRTIKKHVVQRDRWAEIQRVAQVLGCECFADETGNWVIQDIPMITDPSVWTVDAGSGGVLVTASNTVSRADAPSAVVAFNQSGTANYVGIAYDDNPLSPTYYLGGFGLVPRFVNNPLINSQSMADKVAARELQNHLGVSRSVKFTSVPNPALVAGDVVTIVFGDDVTENHLIDVITVPLTAPAALTGETRATTWVAE